MYRWNWPVSALTNRFSSCLRPQGVLSNVDCCLFPSLRGFRRLGRKQGFMDLFGDYVGFTNRTSIFWLKFVINHYKGKWAFNPILHSFGSYVNPQSTNFGKHNWPSAVVTKKIWVWKGAPKQIHWFDAWKNFTIQMIINYWFGYSCLAWEVKMANGYASSNYIVHETLKGNGF